MNREQFDHAVSGCRCRPRSGRAHRDREPGGAPDGWRDRLVRYESPATNGVVAWCVELHDLWIAKAVANRAKDREFCRALLEAGQVELGTLEERLVQATRLDDDRRALVAAFIRALSTR